MDDPVRSSYQQKGTLKTARNIIMHRGVMGLYSGFGFHLCTVCFYLPVNNTH